MRANNNWQRQRLMPMRLTNKLLQRCVNIIMARRSTSMQSEKKCIINEEDEDENQRQLKLYCVKYCNNMVT